MTKIEEKIDKAIALLNEKGPKDWVKSIKVEELMMESCTKCILGQVYGMYAMGIINLNIMDYQSNYGFVTHNCKEWKKLNNLWRQRIIELQNEYI